MNKTLIRHSTRILTIVAVLAAIGVLLVIVVRFPVVPAIPFLEVDFGDTPAMIAAFAISPFAGLLTVILSSVVRSLTVSSQSGWIGALMHIVASGTYVMIAGLMYRRLHHWRGAIMSLIAGTIAAAFVMIPMSLIFMPLFTGLTYDAVAAMIMPVLLPFNLLKFLLNSVLVLALFKPLEFVLNRTR